MILKDLFEGMMKRSDPYISGELEGKRPVPKKTVHDTKILNLAKRAGVSVDKVEQVWDNVRRELDMSLPNAYAILMARTKRVLGVTESLQEAREFKNSELGELTYGWKSKKALCDEEDNKHYIPAEYTKILELGGIFAAEPGKGQGDKLMKQFLASPEAQKADLIFLDPVPGLGANFKSVRSEEQQVGDLVRFYKRYGFRHNPKSATKRMWLVKKGEIPDNMLPT